jgi:hypothetical protein
MLTLNKANEFGAQWVDAWNSHNLDEIMAHYSADIIFSPPFVRKIEADESGTLRGREALRTYFSNALRKFPELSFRLRSVLVGIETVTLLYDSVNDLLAAETMILDDQAKITRVWAQYDNVE